MTRDGQCIRFKETDVRSTGRASMGVRGMNLTDGDEVVAMQLNTQGDYLLVVSENGMGKRTAMSEFVVQNRGGKGVKCYKITEKTGNVVGAKALNEENEIMKQIQLPKKLTEKPAITKKALQRKLSQAVKRNKVEDKS